MIIEFPTNNEEAEDTGYTYFAKAILDSLCSGMSADAKVRVIDKNGKEYEIIGGDACDDLITLYIIGKEQE